MNGRLERILAAVRDSIDIYLNEEHPEYPFDWMWPKMFYKWAHIYNVRGAIAHEIDQLFTSEIFQRLCSMYGPASQEVRLFVEKSVMERFPLKLEVLRRLPVLEDFVSLAAEYCPQKPA